MQIVVVASSYPAQRRPASEPSYTAIAQELARRGHTVIVAAGAEPGLPDREEIAGVSVARSLPRPGPSETGVAVVARACRALRSAMKGDAQTAVVFADATGLPAALLGVAPASRVWVDLGHDWVLGAYAASDPWWAHALSLRGVARLSARALGAVIDPPDAQASSFVVWNEERWKELLLRGLPVQGAHVLRPGVDTRLFAYEEPRLESGSGEIRLHYQGPMRRDGGLNAVFLALQRLPTRVRVRIAAESTEASYLAELGELGRAAGVMDRVDVMPAPGEAQRLALLREAHAFVHSRESSEEFPRFALEAASAGVPVIAARLPGPDAGDWPWEPDSVLEFPAGDPRELAARVEQLLGTAATACTTARLARRLVEARFGVTYTVDQLERRLQGA